MSKQSRQRSGRLTAAAGANDIPPTAPVGPRTNAAPRQNPTIASQPEIKSHSATKGLFAHIQTNNIKSLLVFMAFLFFIQVILAAVVIVSLAFDTGEQTDSLFSPFNQSAPSGPNSRGFSSLKTDIEDDYNRERLAQRNRPVLDVSLRDFEKIWHALFVQKRIFKGGALWILGYSLIFVIGGIFSAAIFVRRQTGAHRVSKFDEPRLYSIIEQLTAGRGLPMPGVEVIECSGRNAYASGFHPRNSAIGVSRGLLDALNDAELEAVLAHEVAHIEGRDNRLMTFANVSVGAISAIGRTIIDKAYEMPFLFVVTAFFTILASPIVNLILFLILVFGAWAGAEAIRLLIFKKREFIADARAIEIMKSPEALISALMKVSRNDTITGINPDVQAMMISNLSGTNQATHPTIAARIRAIEETTSVNYADINAVENYVSMANLHRPGRISDQIAEKAGAASFGKRVQSAHHQSTRGQSSESEQLIEGEKLNQIYKYYKSYQDFISGVSKPAGKRHFLSRLSMMFMVWFAVPLLWAISWLSAMIGVPWQLTLCLLVGGLFAWKYSADQSLQLHHSTAC